MDSDIRAAVYRELVADPLIDADGIEVDIFDGQVTLNGTVPSQSQRSEAVAAARRVAGGTVGRWCKICWLSRCRPATTGTTPPWHGW